MHEKSGTRYALVVMILEHPKNSGRDAYEVQALVKRLSRLTTEELKREHDAL